jgi:hypothetical protein
MILISPRDFVILSLLDVSSPGSVKCRTPVCQLTLSILPMCLLKMDGSDRLRGFHHKETQSLVLRIRDLPNPNVMMDSPLSGIFWSPRIYGTHPLKMDSPHHFTISQLETPNFLSAENPDCQDADGFLNVRHVSKQMDGCDLIAIS